MNRPSKKLIIIGDSSVYGWGDRESGGWSERIKSNWLKLPGGPIVYPLGIRGDGLEKVAQRWEKDWECRGELRRKVPEGILLSVGLNDTARVGRPNGRAQLTAEAFRFGMLQMLKEMKQKTNILVLGLTPIDEQAMPFADCLWYSNEAVSIYESQIEEACLETDIPFLPLHKAMTNQPYWLSWIEPDGIHLNHEGHNWIYEKVIKWPSLLNWAELDQSMNITPTIG